MVVEQLERARLELLDMGLRSNSQLNYRSGSKEKSKDSHIFCVLHTPLQGFTLS